MPLLTRGELLAAIGGSTREVEVPGWGGSVKLRTLSLAATQRLAAFSSSGASEEETQKYLLQQCVAEPAIDDAVWEALQAGDAAPVLHLLAEIQQMISETLPDPGQLKKSFRARPGKPRPVSK